jgi:hypothetical protein
MKISKITLGVYAIIIIQLTFFGLMFYPINPIDFKNNQAIKVDKETYQAGDRLTYTIDYCKYGKYPATVSRALVDGIRINYTSYYNNLPAICSTVNNSDLIIPDFISSGTYHIETTIEYQVTPLQKVIKNWRSVDFKVVNPSNNTTQELNKEQQEIDKLQQDKT